jgi:hypothetical protein
MVIIENNSPPQLIALMITIGLLSTAITIWILSVTLSANTVPLAHASLLANSSSNKPIEVENIGGSSYVLEPNGLRHLAYSPWDEFYHVETLYPNGSLIWNNTQHMVNQIKFCIDTTTPIQDKVAFNTPDCSKPIAPSFGIMNMGSMVEALKHRTVIVKCPGTPQQHC